MDVDQDGWMDQVSGITWFRNTGNPREEQFERYETKGILPYEVVPADINGDGNQDVVLMNDLDGLYWYDVSVNPKKKWKGKKMPRQTIGQQSSQLPPGAEARPRTANEEMVAGRSARGPMERSRYETPAIGWTTECRANALGECRLLC